MDSFESIQPGWEVRGSDGGKIGTVHVAGSDYLEVEKGLIFIKDLFIPRSAIENVEPGEQRVTLNVERDAVGDMGWTEPPALTQESNPEAAGTWGQGTIDGKAPSPDWPASTPTYAGGGTPTVDRPAGDRTTLDAPGGRGAVEPARASADEGSPTSQTDRELVGAGADRMQPTRIEEPADTLSTRKVPTEVVETETLEVWSPVAEDTTVDSGDEPLDDSLDRPLER